MSKRRKATPGTGGKKKKGETQKAGKNVVQQSVDGNPEKESNDYGRLADVFAKDDVDDSVGSVDDDQIEVNDDSDNEDSDLDDEDDEEGFDITAALYQGADTTSHEEDSAMEDDASSELHIEQVEKAGKMAEANCSTPEYSATASTTTSEPYIFDLRNMLAISTDQLATATLYKKREQSRNEMVGSSEARISIPLDPSMNALLANEDFLVSQATAGCTQLIRALWQLPTEQSDTGPLVTLPTYDEIRLPRALPPPPPKQETKWEKFAKAKGIPLNKEKRSRKVWDETTQSWMYRHGFEKANKKDKDWPIMEVGANDDPYEDPWEKQREAKKARVDKNIESRMKNEERVGNLAKGATNRVMKAREKAYKIGKEGGRKDQNVPIGVPIDLKDSTATVATETKLRGKHSTMAALSAVQRSTASLGKFDKLREGEPERRKTLTKMKKRKFESSTDKSVLSSEGETSLKILNTVMKGGGMAKEKAIRKGQLAKGETAYDYDYSDGLGASSFRKKKGRAGVGKMKKMTKKRAK